MPSSMPVRKRTKFKFLYPLEMKLRDRVAMIAKEVYGADGVAWTPEAEAKAKMLEADAKYADYATMMVKTHLSLTHDPAVKGTPKGWTLPIRDVLIYSGLEVPVSLRRSHQPDARNVLRPGFPSRRCGCEDRQGERIVLIAATIFP